jgi:hypothetical protein
MLISWVFNLRRGGPKIMTWVFSMFSESLLALNQSIRRGSSEFRRDSIFLRFGPEEKMFESSANIIVEILFEMVPRSFMQIKNRMGPKIEPWGTPQVIFEVVDILPL